MKTYIYEEFNEFDLEDMKNYLECKVKLKEIEDDGILEDIKDYLDNLDEDYDRYYINGYSNELIGRAVDLLNDKFDDITRDLMKDEICSFINNTESEDYTKLTDAEIDNIAENIVDKVLLDNELNKVLNETIEWYVDHELYKDEDREIPLF